MGDPGLPRDPYRPYCSEIVTDVKEHMNLGDAKVKAGLCSTLYTGHGRELAGKACVHYGRGTNLVDYWEGIFSPDNDVVHVRLTTFASEVLQCFVDTTLRCSVVNRQKRAQ